jgi:hypothetical protein
LATSSCCCIVFVLCGSFEHEVLDNHSCPVCCTGDFSLFGKIGCYGKYGSCGARLGMFLRFELYILHCSLCEACPLIV